MPRHNPRDTARLCLALLSVILVAACRVALCAPPEANLALHRAAYQSTAANFDDTAQLATDGSAQTHWRSGPDQTQWIYVDLGRQCRIDRVRLHWDDAYPTAYEIQVAATPDAPAGWKDIYSTTHGQGHDEDIPLPPTQARYVRLYLTAPAAPGGYALNEFEIDGPALPAPAPRPEPTQSADGTLPLAGGQWKLQSASFVTASPQQISKLGFDDHDWITATVPGTVLTSYLDIGAVPDPFYSDQRFQLSDGFFSKNDFWYRDTLTVPASYRNKRVWLNFEGINWKANVYVNGTALGHIDGAFTRGRFEITSLVKPGQPCALAVLIHQVAHPGPMHVKDLTHMSHNGGILGLDSPTFVGSVGWNWIPTIPGRETGIWNGVFLSATGDVSLADPFVTTDLPLPDVSHADLTVKVDVHNHAAAAVQGVLRGVIGDVHFAVPVRLGPSETRTVVLDKANCPQLALRHPRLWWPNGSGPQNLYHLTLQFSVKDAASDRTMVTFGVRKLTYEVRDNILFISVNGHRILCRGGNWGMDEGLLRCDDAGYDLRVRLHKEMHFNMIRNWVGMTARQGFYDACDRYGILIWDDFWLANPADGPPPTDDALFLANAAERIRRTRNHPSLALYCGRNEGSPPRTLDSGMRQLVAQLDGSRYYIPNSADGIVSGHGPYEVQFPEWYFQNKGTTLHSELGIVAVPPAESMRAMLPPDRQWPINDLWGLHDLSQARGPAYVKRINASYGPSSSLDEFCLKAQMLNLESSKAMLEAWQSKQGSGGLIWMTQAAWPSVICQAYDYYFEPTAAYFGFRTACEPLHILWDQATDTIKVANDTTTDQAGLTASAAIYDLQGHERWHQSAPVSVATASATDCFPLARPAELSGVYFVKLKLVRAGAVVSDNFYWANTVGHDDTALGTLSSVHLTGSVTQTGSLSSPTLTVTLSNPTTTVAVLIRVKAQDAGTGLRVLPAFYSDNYFSLLPGESRTIQVQFGAGATQRRPLKLAVEGWNIQPEVLPLAAAPQSAHS